MIEFPGTAERAKELKEKFIANFEIASRMFSAWTNRPIEPWLLKSDLPSEVLGVAWMFNTQVCRLYRSVVELCEKGEGENAIILARSLFETVLAAQFVLAPKLDVVVENRLGRPYMKPGKAPTRVVLKDKWQVRKRAKGERATGLSRKKRALIYMAHCCGQAVQIADTLTEKHLAATGEQLGPALDPKILATAKSRIGDKWISIQKERPQTYSGLNIKDLADVAGGWYPSWYDSIYPSQSRQVHAVDLITYAQTDSATGLTRAAWFANDHTIWEALYCGSTLFFCFMNCLDQNIGLGHASAMLLEGFLQQLGEIYLPSNADD